MFFNFKKSFLKAIFLSLLAIMSWGSMSSAFAGYVQNWVYVWTNTQAYVRDAQYAPAASLFKSLKWKSTDKAFAQKHGKAMISIIEGFLETQKNLNGDKKQMVTILLSILQDHYAQYSGDKANVAKPNTSTNNNYTKPNTNNNSWFTPSNNYENSGGSLDNGFDDFFDTPSTKPNNNNNGGGFGGSQSWNYTVEQLIRDTGVTSPSAKKWLEGNYNSRCAFGDCGVLKRENFAREIKLAHYLRNNIGVRDSDSQETKITKIYNYINQHAEGKSIPFPYARGSQELNQWLAEHPEVRDAERVLETWNGSCATLSTLYAEFLHLAGVDATIYYVWGMATNGQGGHGFLEINGRYSDVTNRWSTNNPYSWPSLEISPSSISRHNV